MNSTLRLAVSTDDRTNIHTVSLSGELDESSCAELADRLGECRSPGARVLLDMRDLNFMDGAGLALIERIYVESALEGWIFAVMTPGERYVARARVA